MLWVLLAAPGKTCAALNLNRRCLSLLVNKSSTKQAWLPHILQVLRPLAGIQPATQHLCSYSLSKTTAAGPAASRFAGTATFGGASRRPQ